jgi:hypothetical protein
LPGDVDAVEVGLAQQTPGEPFEGVGCMPISGIDAGRAARMEHEMVHPGPEPVVVTGGQGR